MGWHPSRSNRNRHKSGAVEDSEASLPRRAMRWEALTISRFDVPLNCKLLSS